MHKRMKNGEILLWNCVKLACVLEYLQTRTTEISKNDTDSKNVFKVSDQVATELSQEEVDRELLIGEIWPKYQEMYDSFLDKSQSLELVNKNESEEEAKMDEPKTEQFIVDSVTCYDDNDIKKDDPIQFDVKMHVRILTSEFQ